MCLEFAIAGCVPAGGGCQDLPKGEGFAACCCILFLVALHQVLSKQVLSVLCKMSEANYDSVSRVLLTGFGCLLSSDNGRSGESR